MTPPFAGVGELYRSRVPHDFAGLVAETRKALLVPVVAQHDPTSVVAFGGGVPKAVYANPGLVSTARPCRAARPPGATTACARPSPSTPAVPRG